MCVFVAWEVFAKNDILISEWWLKIMYASWYVDVPIKVLPY